MLEKVFSIMEVGSDFVLMSRFNVVVIISNNSNLGMVMVCVMVIELDI